MPKNSKFFVGNADVPPMLFFGTLSLRSCELARQALTSIAFTSVALSLLSCDRGPSTESLRSESIGIQKAGADASGIGTLEFDRKRKITLSVTASDYSNPSLNLPGVNQGSVFLSRVVDDYGAIAPGTGEFASWLIVDHAALPKWNYARIEFRKGGQIVSSQAEEFPIRDLDQSSSKILLASESRLLIHDTNGLSIFSVLSDENKISKTSFRPKSGSLRILFASEKAIWTKTEDKSLALLQPVQSNGALVIKSQPFLVASFDASTVCVTSTGTLFIGRGASYFWPSGESKLISTQIEGEASALESLVSGNLIGRAFASDPDGCVFEDREQTGKRVLRIKSSGAEAAPRGSER
jgi:hypothetical protein